MSKVSALSRNDNPEKTYDSSSLACKALLSASSREQRPRASVSAQSGGRDDTRGAGGARSDASEGRSDLNVDHVSRDPCPKTPTRPSALEIP